MVNTLAMKIGSKKLKILNLYAGIGGNRKLWGNEHDITAVELAFILIKTKITKKSTYMPP